MTRIRILLIGALSALVLFAVPALASADTFMSKPRAQSFARDFVNSRYDTSGVVAFCRPQGANAPASGYIYHRWVCGWASDDYSGKLLIVGSRGNGYYYGKVLRGAR